MSLNIVLQIILITCFKSLFALDFTSTHHMDASNDISERRHHGCNVKRQMSDTKYNHLVNPLQKGMYPTPLFQEQRTALEFEEPYAIFFVPIQSTVKITLDLRHILNTTNIPNVDFIYGTHWKILIAVKSNFTLEDLKTDFSEYEVSMPDIFTRDETNKLDSHLFKLFAYEDLTLVVFVRIISDFYYNMRTFFLQCGSVEIETPMRAVYGENKIFPFVIKNNNIVNLPRNLPMWIGSEYPPSLLTYSPLDTTSILYPLKQTDNDKTIQLTNSKYWGNRDQLILPYIPYITNCKGYGEYVFLHEVIENPNFCNLISVQNTKPVEQIGFKQNPISDQCDSILFQCLLDEAYSDNQNYPKFYMQKELTELFYITKYPMNIKDYVSGDITFKSLDLIPIISKNEVPSSSLPKSIQLQINYFQVNQEEKRIITASMTFGKFIAVSSSANETTPFQFNFTLSLHSMSHAELAIAFALEWPIYLLLSCIIGIFSIGFTILYHIFFRLANLVIHYIQLYTPIFQGILLGVIPSFLLHTIASLAMLGGFWSYPLQDCTTLTTDEICENSIIEIFFGQSISQQLRRGRLGITLIIIGFYGCIRISAVFIPISTTDRVNKEVDYQIKQTSGSELKILKQLYNLIERPTLMVTECYDGNIWFDKVWKRGLYMFMALLIWTLMLIILNLSFSTFYGVNQWLFTVLLKVTQIFIEESLKIYIENELLLGSLSCVIAMSLSVSGLGALNFFEYLFTYFVSLGISTFEKTNQVLVVDIISDTLFDTADNIKKWVEKQFDYDEGDQNEELQQKSKPNNTTKEGTVQENADNDSVISGIHDSENSGIVLTEMFEESIDTFDDNFEIDSHQNERQQTRNTSYKMKQNAQLNKQRRTLLYNEDDKQLQPSQNGENAQTLEEMNERENEEYNDNNNNDDDDEFELKCNRILNIKIKSQNSQTAKDGEKKKTEGDQQQEKDSERIKIYTDFCNNTFTLIQTPFQVVQMWMFYDANQSFVLWGITKAGLIFYFLFNISNIPFQIVMDLLFLKTVEQFHQMGIKDYVQQVRQRFKNRKFNWKTEDEDEYLKNIDKDLQYIDIWCFSSQYFFSLSVFVGGSMAIIQGSLICLANQYNFFRDSLLLGIVLFSILTCFIIDVGCIQFYNYSSLWKINDKEKKGEVEEEEEVEDEHKNTEHQGLIASQFYTNQDQTDKKYYTENNEETRQVAGAFNQIHIFSRDSLFIRQNTEGDQLAKQSLFYKNSIANRNREQYQEYDHKYSIRNDDCDIERHYQQKNSFGSSSLNQSFYVKQEFAKLRHLIHSNRYIKLFLEDAICQSTNYDLSIQNYLVQMLQKKEKFNLSLKDKYKQNEHKFRVPRDPDPSRKEKKWMSFKVNFKKSEKLKTKQMKLKELMSKFENKEYLDERFKQRFLQANRNWFKKNAFSLFQDLMIGESSKDLLKYRPLILSGFNEIYGDIKKDNLDVQLKMGEKEQTASLNWEKRSTKSSLNNLICIIKYWHHRSKVLNLAEKCIAGYILKGEKKNCYYCKQSWGITMQLQNTNIEDLFLNFYKKESRRQRQLINVFQLVQGNSSIQKGKTGLFSSQRRLSRRIDNTFLFDQMSHDSVNEVAFDQNSYFVSRQQKFIESWQEQFIQNGKFINVCLLCNDRAQTAFAEEVCYQRSVTLKTYQDDYHNYFQLLLQSKQLLEDTTDADNTQYLNSSYNITATATATAAHLKDKDDDLDNQSPSHLICDMVFNHINHKKQATIQPQNTIIREENNEDQSQIGDKLSRQQSSEIFYSPQPNRKKSSQHSRITALRRSKSSVRSVMSPMIPSQRINNFLGLKLGQSIEEISKQITDGKNQTLDLNENQLIDLNENQPLDFNENEHLDLNEENNNYRQPIIIDRQFTTRERKQSELQAGSRSFRTINSLSKTHPDLSQNNIDDINISRRSDVKNQRIEEINRNLEENNNRSFRLLETFPNITEHTIDGINKDDFGYTLDQHNNFNYTNNTFNNSNNISNNSNNTFNNNNNININNPNIFNNPNNYNNVNTLNSPNNVNNIQNLNNQKNFNNKKKIQNLNNLDNEINLNKQITKHLSTLHNISKNVTPRNQNENENKNKNETPKNIQELVDSKKTKDASGAKQLITNKMSVEQEQQNKKYKQSSEQSFSSSSGSSSSSNEQEDKHQSSIFLNTSLNQQDFITPTKQNQNTTENKLFTEHERLHSQAGQFQLNSQIQEDEDKIKTASFKFDFYQIQDNNY